MAKQFADVLRTLEEQHDPLAQQYCCDRKRSDRSSHAERHPDGHNEACQHNALSSCVDHNEGCEGTRNKSSYDGQGAAIAHPTSVFVSTQGLDQEPQPSCDDHRCAYGLKGWGTPNAANGAANDNEPGQYQDNSRTHVRERQNGTGHNAAENLPGSSQIIGDDHCLAMSGHQGVNHPEDTSNRHCGKEVADIESCR